VAVVAAGVSLYRYYEVGTKEFLGISLVEILSEHLGKEVSILVQFGVYLAAAGLVVLILGGLLRLLLAARA
jgi:prepilin signal peptidase PulO-like enzyme (type II secretory pathway)